MKPRTKPKIGDIIEVKTEKGMAYVQYTAKHITPPVFGELVRVLPGLHHRRPPDFAAIAREKERYFVFTPISLACRRKRAVIVAHEMIPSRAQGIPVMRMANRIDSNGKGHDWYLWDGVKSWPAMGSIAQLRELSIASIWGHDILVEKLGEGWLPSDDFDDDVQLTSQGTSGLNRPKTVVADSLQSGQSENIRRQQVRHYLYFASKNLAKRAGAVLQAQGYAINVRPSSDGDRWLVEASSELALQPQVLSEASSSLRSLASANGGEYDGWEVLVSDDTT